MQRLLLAVLYWTVNFLMLILVALFTFPFLFFAAVVAARYPGPAAFSALALLVVSAALLFGTGQMWGSRQASFRMLHDVLYRFRGLPLREHTVEDYIDRYDPRIRQVLFQFRDLRAAPDARTHRIRMFSTDERDSAGLGHPLACVNPAALGLSYIVLKDPPEDVQGAGWFTVLHELGHARPHYNPLYLHLLLGATPYWIAALCALPLFPAGWPGAGAAVVLLLATSRLVRAHDTSRAANRLFEEASADRWAIELLRPAERAALRHVLTGSPRLLERDETIPEPLRGMRTAVLRANLERLEEDRPTVALDWWRFFPWRLPVLGIAALGALALTSRPPGVWTAVVPAAFVFAASFLSLTVVLASHGHLEREVDHHLRFTGIMSGLRGVLEGGEGPVVIPGYLPWRRRR